jgi:predicted nucleic acid-binding Zn ribbon protein
MSGSDGRPPRRVADGLDRVLNGLGQGRRSGPQSGRPSAATGSAGLFSRWEQLVGPEIAAHARPLGVRDGELVVVVDDPAWASQIRWLSHDLLVRIASTGGPSLEGLRVRVKPR